MSMYKSWWKSIYTKIIMKSNYKNTQNKWQDNYAKWFIELKKIFQINKFSRNFKWFYKKWFWINDFNLFIYKT